MSLYQDDGDSSTTPLRASARNDSQHATHTIQSRGNVGVDTYESLYRDFNSPLMRQIRREAYGEDIGQHSWVGADELRRDIDRLELSSSSRFADFGCGPCGPLTFVVSAVRCNATGLDVSPAALRAGQERANSLGIGELLTAREADLNAPLPFDSASIDAAMSLDVVLHLRDRSSFFREVARTLRPGGRFLLTDAGVVTGSISADEVRSRSQHGHTELVPPGWNEAQLEAAGFRVIETENRTSSVMKNASGRLAAFENHRPELERMLGAAQLAAQEEYLATVVELSRREALSRVMYFCGRR